jgi:D-glycero-alpha-D-manno-heptose 1-phosphate guanylyltransferase
LNVERRALILAGGFGTRLKSVIADHPKILAPVGGRPFVTHILDQLARAGFSSAVLATGHLAEAVEKVLGSRYDSLKLEYSPEPAPLGTAGAIAHARSLLLPGGCLVMNGDSICLADLASYWNWAVGRKAAVALLLAHVEDARRFGTVRLNGDVIVSFEEKGSDAVAEWINAGVYYLSDSLLDSLEQGQRASFERDILPRWIGKGMYGWTTDAPFLDIGLPESYASATGFMSGAARQ